MIEFYNNDGISRMMPGMRDCKVMRNEHEKIYVQRKLLLYTLREAHNLFKIDYPLTKIGFSKFACLKPKNIIFAGSPGTHCVCVCIYHQNVKLMFESE